MRKKQTLELTKQEVQNALLEAFAKKYPAHQLVLLGNNPPEILTETADEGEGYCGPQGAAYVALT